MPNDGEGSSGRFGRNREGEGGSPDAKIRVFACEDSNNRDGRWCFMPKLPPPDGSMHARSSQNRRHYTSAYDEHMKFGKLVKSTAPGNVDPLFRVDGDPQFGAWIIERW
jgi:hypothetical protein